MHTGDTLKWLHISRPGKTKGRGSSVANRQSALIKASSNKLNVMNPCLIKTWREWGGWIMTVCPCVDVCAVCGRAGWTELASMTAMQLHPLPPNQVGRSQRGLWTEDRRRVGSELGRSGRHPPPHTPHFLFMSSSLPLHCPTNGKK